MSAPRVWITGAGGLIGSQLAIRAAELVPGWQVMALTRGELDLTDFSAVDRRFATDQPELALHCAALSRSPACQADPTLATRLNAEVTHHLAGLFAGRTLLFLSSDLVFDGRKGAYVETDVPHPLSVYAETKVAAERAVLAQPGNIVIRTSLNHGRSPTGDRSFNEELLASVRAGRTLRLFTDEFRCPIPVEATARAIWTLAQLVAKGPEAARPTGIFHLAGAERLSRWAIGELLALDEPAFRGRIERGARSEYTGAPRPQDTSMNCAKLQALLDFPLPRLSEWLAERRTGSGVTGLPGAAKFGACQ